MVKPDPVQTENPPGNAAASRHTQLGAPWGPLTAGPASNHIGLIGQVRANAAGPASKHTGLFGLQWPPPRAGATAEPRGELTLRVSRSMAELADGPVGVVSGRGPRMIQG